MKNEQMKETACRNYIYIMFSKPKYVTNCFRKLYKIDAFKKHIRYKEMKQS